MARKWDPMEIALGLGSADEETRRQAVGEFVRLFVASAPTDLALWATRFPRTCAAYRGDRPLAQYLLESLPLPRDMALAWRIALLEDEELRKALQEFDALCGDRLCRRPSPGEADADDAYQDVMGRLLEDRAFRRTFFGRYCGRGELIAFAWTAFVRRARGDRKARERRRVLAESNLCGDPSTHADAPPDRALAQKELHDKLVAVLAEISDDPGFVPFLLQEGFEMAHADVAKILTGGMENENALRQRTLRFRERFRDAWRRLHPSDPDPLRPQNSSE